MRWLIAKDLRILRRSPLLVALLVLYPVTVAVLAGLGLSAGPEKPRVAIANLVPAGSAVTLGGERLDANRYLRALSDSVEPIRVETRAEAVAAVERGEALGALIVPADLPERLQATLDLAAAEPPALEVVYDAGDPVRRRFVQAALESRVAEANRALSAEVTRVAAGYLDVVVRGGELRVLGRRIDVLGLERSGSVLRATLATLPRDAPERVALEQVARFAALASQNLGISEPILASIGTPVRVQPTLLDGGGASLDAYAVAAAVTASLAFIALLLGAGLVALEREEGALGRLLGGLVSPGRLVGAKLLVTALCAAAAAGLLLGVLALFVGLDPRQAGGWFVALVGSALAFAALGVLLGGVAREVRAASLLAFGLGLPLAVLALVPAGTVAGPLGTAVAVLSVGAPFAPALDALEAAVSGGALVGPLLHLAALTLVFAAIARAAVGRAG